MKLLDLIMPLAIVIILVMALLHRTISDILLGFAAILLLMYGLEKLTQQFKKTASG